jgi:hypothetical protein
MSGSELAVENPKGGIEVGSPQGNAQSIVLPVTPLNAIEASAFSPNGRYLAVSDPARGAEWDLSTGKRMAVTSPFRSVTIDDSGKLQSAFIPHELNPSGYPDIDKLMHKYVPGLSPYDDPWQLGTARIRFKPLSYQEGDAGDVRIDAYDVLTEKHLRSRTFVGWVPQIVDADGDQTLFVTGRQNWTGSGKLIHTSDLPFQFINPIGTVSEIFSNRTGKPVHIFYSPQLPVGGRSDERTAGLFGNLLAVYGNNNDTTVYRVPTGKRLFAFFGNALAGDDALSMLAATNRIQELNIYDTASGKRLAHYLLDQAVISARFVPGREQLRVLTASQRVYRIDLSRLSPEN